MDELIKAMADGGEFDVTEGMRALAAKLLQLEAKSAASDALLTNVNGRSADSADGGKKK